MPPALLSRRNFLRTTAASLLGLGLVRGAARAVGSAAADLEEAALRGADPAVLGPYRLGGEIYRNPLRAPGDLAGFRLEGRARTSFPAGRLRVENALDPTLGQKSNFVYWLPSEFPADFAASWQFRPIREPGLAMVFFGARARRGGEIFGPGVAPRSGEYAQYHHGDIDTLHLSYFRRSRAPEWAFHVCNLRKSYGFHLVAEGADPLPSAREAVPPYRVDLVKLGPEVAFFIDRLPILSWRDDGRTYGPVLGAGRFGFRQLAPLQAEYEDLVVRTVTRAPVT